MTPVSVYKLASDIEKEVLLVMEVPPEDIFTRVSTLCTLRFNELSLEMPDHGPAFVFFEKINGALESVCIEIQQHLDETFANKILLDMYFEPPDVIHCSIRVNRTTFPQTLNITVH